MTDDTGRADWPAILRAANQDRTDRDAAQRALAQLHAWAGHRQPGAAREIRAWQDAVRIIAPIRGSVPAIVAQAQRESADLAASIARHYRAYRAGIFDRSEAHRAAGDHETAAYLYRQATGRELMDPEYLQRRSAEHWEDSGAMYDSPILVAARAIATSNVSAS